MFLNAAVSYGLRRNNMGNCSSVALMSVRIRIAKQLWRMIIQYKARGYSFLFYLFSLHEKNKKSKKHLVPSTLPVPSIPSRPPSIDFRRKALAEKKDSFQNLGQNLPKPIPERQV